MSDLPNDEPEISGEHVPASHVFSNEIINLISEEDITKIVDMQRYMLGRYEKSNEMLVTVTELASQRFEVLGNEFKNHTTTLLEMKKDLDSIFKRINNLKQIMSKRYPKEFDIALCNSTRLLEEDEDASDDALSLGASAPEDTISLPDTQNTQQLSASTIAALCHLPASFYQESRQLVALIKFVIHEVNYLASNQKRARHVLLIAAVVAISLVLLLIWCHGSNSLSLVSLSYLLSFDLLCLMIALLSVWVDQQQVRVSFATYPLGYTRFEVVAVFSVTILAILTSIFTFKEAVERILEPVDIVSGRLILGGVLTLLVHLLSLYSVHNRSIDHVIKASGSSWLQEHVTDMSEGLCQVIPGLSKALLPRINPLSLLGVASTVIVIIIDFCIDSYEFVIADSIGALVIGLMILGSMMPMAIYSGRILLQTTPSHLVAQLDKALREASTLDGVLELRKEHFWTLGFGELVGSLHVRVRRDANEQMVLAGVTNRVSGLVNNKLTIQVFKDDWTRSVGSFNFNWPVNQPISNTPRVNPFLSEKLPDLVQTVGSPRDHSSKSGSGTSSPNPAYTLSSYSPNK